MTFEIFSHENSLGIGPPQESQQGTFPAKSQNTKSFENHFFRMFCVLLISKLCEALSPDFLINVARRVIFASQR